MSYAQRNGTASTSHPNQLQNIYHCRHCQQHHQATALTIHGNAFFWVADAVAQEKFDIIYFPGKENLADYQSKHHSGSHHVAVCLWYLHEPTSVRELPRSCKPSTLKGCVGTLPDGYVCVQTCFPKFPLGRVSQQVGSAYLLTWEYQY